VTLAAMHCYRTADPQFGRPVYEQTHCSDPIPTPQALKLPGNSLYESWRKRKKNLLSLLITGIKKHTIQINEVQYVYLVSVISQCYKDMDIIKIIVTWWLIWMRVSHHSFCKWSGIYSQAWKIHKIFRQQYEQWCFITHKNTGEKN
jgi:hypothetical protein